MKNESVQDRDTDAVADIEAEDTDDAIIVRAMWWSLGVLLVLLISGGGLVLLMIRPPAAEPVSPVQKILPRPRPQPQVEAPRVPFVDITKVSGIDFWHENGAYGDKLLPETMGGGCAFLDYDGDGWQDILLVNSSRWPWDTRQSEAPATMALYRNVGGQFVDVTEKLGLDLSAYGMGAAVGDYDNDGDTDIFISAVGPNVLLRNDGDRFVDITDEAGVAGSAQAWGTSCGWFDYNNDGRLDLFVANYVTWSKDIDLAQDFRIIGVGRAYGPPMAFQGSFPYLYRNDGEGRFTDVSAESGIQITNPATDVPMAKSMGLAPLDLDADGWLDMVVANDTVQNFVFHNNRDGTFTEIGAASGVAFDSVGNARGAMGIDSGRFRNDQTMGIAIGNFSNEMTALYAAAEDPMQFVDLAVATGLGPQTRLELTFGLFFFDYDLDGRLDLMCANGHIEEEINKVQSSQRYRQSPQLFWNCGSEYATEFTPVTERQCGQDLFRPIVGRGAAYADVDNDGDLDVLLTEIAGQPRLLRNDQQLGRNWIRLELIGTKCNRDAIGSRVKVLVDGAAIERQVMPTRSYLSQCELPVTIGIGDATSIEKLVVHWPDGDSTEITDVIINSTTRVEQLVE